MLILEQLMELLQVRCGILPRVNLPNQLVDQSSLLKYWDFQPMTDKARKALAEEAVKDGKVGSSQDLAEEKLREGFGKSDADLKEARTIPQENGGDGVVAEDEAELKPPSKKIPVFFLDEAHKVSSLRVWNSTNH